MYHRCTIDKSLIINSSSDFALRLLDAASSIILSLFYYVVRHFSQLAFLFLVQSHGTHRSDFRLQKVYACSNVCRACKSQCMCLWIPCNVGNCTARAALMECSNCMAELKFLVDEVETGISLILHAASALLFGPLIILEFAATITVLSLSVVCITLFSWTRVFFKAVRIHNLQSVHAMTFYHASSH